MLNIFARASVSRVTDPVGAWLVRAGLKPNTMTVIGTVGTVASALWFIPHDLLFPGAVLVTLFIMFDLLDGAMARTSGQVTKYGNVLDASCDRIADAVLFGCLAWWCFVPGNDRITGAAALICFGGAQVISYIKARAEAAGLAAEGGLVERAERFILALVGTGLQGLGVPHALSVALWLLAAGVLITVGQRLVAVHRSAHGPEQAGAAEEADQK